MASETINETLGEALPREMARVRDEVLRRWEDVRRWCRAAGIDYESQVVADIPAGALTPLSRIRHPMEHHRLRAAARIYRLTAT